MFDDSGTASSTSGDSQSLLEDPALVRFRACRWHNAADGAPEYCSHRDVLPYAGKNGFSPRAWCPDCSFFKTRRRTRKRYDADFDDY